jgi:hypothetical protein
MSGISPANFEPRLVDDFLSRKLLNLKIAGG